LASLPLELDMKARERGAFMPLGRVFSQYKNHASEVTLQQSTTENLVLHVETAGDARTNTVVVNDVFPPNHCESGVPVEIIRDPQNPRRLVFLRWENGSCSIFDSIEHQGTVFVPPDPTSCSFPELGLPDRVLSCGDPSDLQADVGSTISKFVKLRHEDLRIVSAFVLASWFPECFEVAPYLFVVGPLGSGKTKLLKILWSMCRRSVIVGDLRPGSLYKLLDTWKPTLIIDELELGTSMASSEFLRMLRTGSMPGVPTPRNGLRFCTYGMKVIASRQPINDAALLSRGIVISMLPASEDTPPLDEQVIHELENEWQAKLCQFRLENFELVKTHCHSTHRLQGLRGRIRQIGLALTAPFGESHECLSTLHAILLERDAEGRIERALEPEWVVAEVLLEICHEQGKIGYSEDGVTVGDLSACVNKKLEKYCEHVRFSAKKVGLIMRSLGLTTSRLGRSGRGLIFGRGLQRDIHEVASQLGMLQWSNVSGKGHSDGTTCQMCEQYRPCR
jgi:hypothetical protein